MRDIKDEKKSWGKIAWHCDKCDVNIIQDELKKCPFCGNENLKKEERKD